MPDTITLVYAEPTPRPVFLEIMRARPEFALRRCGQDTPADAVSALFAGAQAYQTGSLRDVAESVEASSGRYVSFGLSSGYRVTINREEARANAHEVLQRYGVALDRSERLQAALAAQRLPGSGLTAGNAAVSSVNEPAKTELIR